VKTAVLDDLVLGKDFSDIFDIAHHLAASNGNRLKLAITKGSPDLGEVRADAGVTRIYARWSFAWLENPWYNSWHMDPTGLERLGTNALEVGMRLEDPFSLQILAAARSTQPEKV
jgi:hypothetical protein